MSKSIVKSFAVGTTLLISLLILSFIGTQAVSAQSEEPAEDQTQTTETVEAEDSEQAVESDETTENTEDASDATFTYTASKGDNLTLLVRRSIQLYAASQNIELSTAQLIAAETCAVQELGAFELNVGQEVDVPEALVMEATGDVADLSEAAQQRWLAYGPVQEMLENIKPDAAPEYVEPEQLSEAGAEAREASTNSDAPLVEVSTEVGEDDDDSAPIYWWFIGGASIAAMWYILGGNELIAERRKK